MVIMAMFTPKMRTLKFPPGEQQEGINSETRTPKTDSRWSRAKAVVGSHIVASMHEGEERPGTLNAVA